VQAAWAFITDILDAWKTNPARYLPVYEAGTWGPPEMDEFVRSDDGHGWHND
jgi:glucose-6-phosphate 1-dehydrogenase